MAELPRRDDSASRGDLPGAVAAGHTARGTAALKILLYGLNYAPETVGTGRYSGELGAWLAARGHRVKVIAAPPYYPAWRVAPGAKRWWRRETLDGVQVRRCPLWVPRRPRGWSRLLHLASFALSSLPVALWQGLTWRPDVVVAVAPTLAAAPGAWLAARLGGARAWLHLQDFELEAAFGLGIARGGALKRLALRLERCLLRRFDRVSSISPAMLRRLEAKGVAPERLVEFRNWVDCQAIRPTPADAHLRAALALPEGKAIALYSGNLGEKQGLELLVAAARQLARRDDLLLLLVGAGAARERLATEAAGLANLVLRPLVPPEQLNALLSLATLHLLPQRADAADLVLPSKLTGMLASGRPVVATAAAGTGLAAELEGCGLLVPPGDAAALAQAIERLLDRPELAAALGEAARERALARWDRAAILGGFEAALGAALAGAPPPAVATAPTAERKP